MLGEAAVADGGLVSGTLEERAYLSIGEVLALLKEEFPDVTISKIRFLESQGLLDPERTPSGYRKFYDTDVERLRWILRQQREHFLPLKVIKGRLRGGPEVAEEAPDEAGQPADAVPQEGDATPVPAPPTAPAETPAAAVSPLPPPPVLATDEPPLVLSSGGVSMNIAELAAASGLQEDDLHELERYGLLSGRRAASSVYYDEEALSVAQLAAGFMKYGVEARHLRMYKTAAEREAGFYEQVVLPLVKQRNPTARRQAVETLEHLSQLGEGLRAAFLRAALREYTEG